MVSALPRAAREAQPPTSLGLWAQAMSDDVWVPAGHSRSGQLTWPKGGREGPAPPTCAPASRGLKGVEWEQVVVGRRGEVELLAGGVVVAWAA